MRIPARLSGPLRKTARNASLLGIIVVLGLAGLLIASRWFPSQAPVVVWWPFEVVGWLVVLIAGALTFDSIRAWLDPSKHAAIVRLAETGEIGPIISKLVDEIDGDGIERHGAAKFTASYLIVEDWISYAILPIDRIVWCYAVETQHRKYGVIPMGRSFRVFVALRGGEKFDFASTASDHENVLMCIGQRPGHRGLIGYDEALAEAWDKHHEGLTAGIDLMASEGRLHEGTGAVFEAAQRAAAKLADRGRAAVEKARETLSKL